MIHNLTDIQKKSIEKAAAKANLLQQQTNMAVEHYRNLMELICDAHGIEYNPDLKISNGQIFVADKLVSNG